MKKNGTTSKLWAHPEEIARNEQQPRTHFDAEALQRLGVSLKRKQQQPVTVVRFEDKTNKKVQFKIVDGERRWRAAKTAGITKLWITIDDDVQTAADLHTSSFAANWCRAGHTHAETAHAIDKQRAQGKSYEEIGDIVGKGAAWALNEHKLLGLHPSLFILLDPPTAPENRLPTKVALALVAHPQEKQVRLWNKFKDKRGSDIFHHVRTAAPASTFGNRRAGDDRQFILGRIKSATGIIAKTCGLPDAMFRRLSRADREKIHDQLMDASKRAMDAAELLAGGRGIEDDEQ